MDASAGVMTPREGGASGLRLRRLLERLERPGQALGLLALLFLLTAVVVLRQTTGTTLWFDDWTWAIERRGWTADALLQPHNDHLSLVPLLIVKVLYATAGIGHDVPYRISVVMLHLLCVGLVFAHARRRAGTLIAVTGAGIIAFLGPAWQNFLWPFQIGWLIPIAGGIAALLALERQDNKGDVAACGLVALCLASSGVGVAVTVGVLVEIALTRRWRSLWVVLVPMVPYAAWWIAYQDSTWIELAKAQGIAHPVRSGLANAPGFAVRSAAASLAAAAGLGGAIDFSGRGESGTLLVVGPSLLVAAIVVLAWRVRRRGVATRTVTLLSTAITFWLLSGVSRGFVSGPTTSRYLYVGVVFIVLIGGELVTDLRRRPIAVVLIAFACVIAAFGNVGQLRAAGSYFRAEAVKTRAALASAEIARPILPSNFKLLLGFEAGPYFAATQQLGSPADTEAELLREPERGRLIADSELMRMQSGALRRTPSHLAGGGLPRLAAVGGTLRRSRGCSIYAPDYSAGGAGEVSFMLPPSGARITAVGAAATVKLKRFADAPTTLASLEPGRPAVLRMRVDRSTRPWSAFLSFAGGGEICGVAPA